MDWIVYGDDWEYTSEDGPPESVPGRGVLVIAQAETLVGREMLSTQAPPELLHGSDRPNDVFAYWWDADQWVCGDFVSFLLYMQRPGWKCARFAVTVPNARFREVLRAALEDDRLPRKTAQFRHEARP